MGDDPCRGQGAWHSYGDAGGNQAQSLAKVRTNNPAPTSNAIERAIWTTTRIRPRPRHWRWPPDAWRAPVSLSAGITCSLVDRSGLRSPFPAREYRPTYLLDQLLKKCLT